MLHDLHFTYFSFEKKVTTLLSNVLLLEQMGWKLLFTKHDWLENVIIRLNLDRIPLVIVLNYLKSLKEIGLFRVSVYFSELISECTLPYYLSCSGSTHHIFSRKTNPEYEFSRIFQPIRERVMVVHFLFWSFSSK